MARSIQEFVQSLLRGITTYYTATYSTDTNLYRILQTYGAQFASGSLELDTTRGNAFVISCDSSKLYHNFGTFFSQNKYYLQSNTDDKYFSGSAVYIYTLPTTSFVQTQSVSSSYFDGFAVRGQQSAAQFNGDAGYLLGEPVGGELVPAFSKVYFKAVYQPVEYGLFNKAYVVGFDPAQDEHIPVDPTLAGNTDLGYPFFANPSAGYIYSYGPWGLQTFNAYLGNGKFGPTQLCLWKIDDPTSNYPEIKLKRSFDGTEFEDVLPTAFTFVTNGDPVNPDGAKFAAARRAVSFHSKLYSAMSGVPSNYAAPYQAYPVCLVYDGTSVSEAGLYTTALTTSFTGDHCAQVIFIHDNKLYCVFNHRNGTTNLAPLIYSYDTFDWQIVVHSFAAGDVINDCISFDGDTYTAVADSAGAYFRIIKNFNTTHQSFTAPVYVFTVHEGRAYVGSTDGQIYRLNVAKTEWEAIVKIDNPTAGAHIRALSSYKDFNHNSLYALCDRRLWSSDTDIVNYTTSSVSGSTFRYDVVEQASLPSYRKQLSFMMEGAVLGATPAGITRMVNGFTLINPDIREFVNIPSWKLKTASGSVAYSNLAVSQISSNVWQFNLEHPWRNTEWRGSHALFVSGSLASDKVTAGYLVMTNSSNTVTIAPIYEEYLRL